MINRLIILVIPLLIGAVELEPVLDSVAGICGDNYHVCLKSYRCTISVILFYLWSLIFLILIRVVAVFRLLPAEISVAFDVFHQGRETAGKLSSWN